MVICYLVWLCIGLLAGVREKSLLGYCANIWVCGLFGANRLMEGFGFLNFWILHNLKKCCTQYTKLPFLQGLREVIVRQSYSFFEVDSQIRTLDLLLLDFRVLNATNHCVVC